MVVRYAASFDAKLWCWFNLGQQRKTWDCYHMHSGNYRFTFKNAADATWFALVHGEKLV